MADNQAAGPDWGVIGGAVATVLTAAAAAVAGARGAFKRPANGAPVPSVDHTALTLESAFRLINELQSESERKGAELIQLETRCAARVDALDRRIAGLERELRALRQRPRGITDRDGDGV